MSEILAEHKKILPAKYDRKGQSDIIGSDDLPFPICITQAKMKGSHHFHFQHGPYSRRFVMCARNFYRCSVQLSCKQRGCSGRVNVTPNNPKMIKCIGERQSKEGKKLKPKRNMPLTGNAPMLFLRKIGRLVLQRSELIAVSHTIHKNPLRIQCEP